MENSLKLQSQSLGYCGRVTVPALEVLGAHALVVLQRADQVLTARAGGQWDSVATQPACLQCGNPEGPLLGQQRNFAWTFKSLWRYFYTKVCPARALQGLGGGLWHQDHLRSQEMLDARR